MLSGRSATALRLGLVSAVLLGAGACTLEQAFQLGQLLGGTDDQAGQPAPGAPGPEGPACWDRNRNGVAEPAEDVNGDGQFNALDCKGADGADGQSGAAGQRGPACWDLNGDRIAQPEEDVNGDGNFDANDCRGRTGAAGSPGAAGPVGPAGEQGNRGPAGQRGPAGGTGAQGFACWDLNQDGLGELDTEDITGDNALNALDCIGPRGLPGASGAPGRACWDLNGDGLGQLETEDLNGDGHLDALDCRGAEGPTGAVGPPGAAGPQGAAGLPGIVGPPGEDADLEFISTFSPIAPAGYSYTGVSYGIGDGWRSSPSIPGNARWYPSAVGYNGKVYVFGGYSCGDTVTGFECSDLDETRIFDVATGTWSEGAPMPVRREAAVVVALNGLIYVIGGANYPSGSPYEPFSRVDVYDPISDTWSQVASMLEPREAAAGAVLNGKIYVAGGYFYDSDTFTQYYLDTAEVYDPLSDTWTPIAGLPVGGGYAPAGAALAGRFCVIGGYTYDDFVFQDVYHDEVQAYDPASDTWETLAPLPVGRIGAAVGVVDGRLFLTGGTNDGPAALRDTLEYDPAIDAWTARVTPPDRRSYGGAAVVGRELFVVGGSLDTPSGGSFSSDDTSTCTSYRTPTYLYLHQKN